ncbi:hypothetical protein VE01_07911 [Pseudogymnoascus verrucosus]|uniref:Uncharacterized protein n=1 Tax=Pseudogymnoascus verrucosus TaxID=342668 RepID=A0A1B8GFG4_9PEZI|nr:uncharacterized protein VE01_07911 [Pseudogymnoascus verrucosus]OBT94579.1 hypothetical protein VE01_07911 [Pseudogymnoascus verrucosus]
MSSKTLSSVLRSGASILKPRQSQPIGAVSCPSPVQKRFYTPNHDDPSTTTSSPSQNDLPNIKLHALLNSIPLSQKIRYVKDASPTSLPHPTTPPGLLSALLHPSPPPYTIGTDICHIPRIHRILVSQLAEPGYVEGAMPRFWTRTLSPLEARYSGWKAAGGVDGSAKFLAGRWAAKEAVIKAVAAAWPGGGKVFMHDIVILNAKTQLALLEARKAAVRIEAREAGVREEEEVPGGEGEGAGAVVGEAPRAFVKLPGAEGWWVEVSVSISHDGEYATATALVAVDPKIAGVRREKSLVREVVAKTYTDERYL